MISHWFVIVYNATYFSLRMGSYNNPSGNLFFCHPPFVFFLLLRPFCSFLRIFMVRLCLRLTRRVLRRDVLRAFKGMLCIDYANKINQINIDFVLACVFGNPKKIEKHKYFHYNIISKAPPCHPYFLNRKMVFFQTRLRQPTT